MNYEQFEGHTPGPWLITGDDGDITEIASETCYVADVCLIGGCGDSDANARLIAAAPDLLAENKRLWQALAAAHDAANDTPELNMSNYNHDLVQQLNDGMIEVFLVLDTALQEVSDETTT